MTRYSKLLAIFVTVASLAFVGFAVATTFGGPDWEAVQRAPDFDGYKITRSEGPQILWTAVRASDEQQIAQSRRLPEVLVKVMDDITREQQEEIQELSTREPLLQQRVEALAKTIQDDKAALERYEAQQRERLTQVRDQEMVVAAQVLTSTAESQKLQNIVASRREDILRLRQQAAELKIDQYRLNEIEQQLNSLLIQTQGNDNRARARNELLKKQLAEP